MIAAGIALCCASLPVVAFRREGRPITFSDDFRTLFVSGDPYKVDWVTGTIADLAVDSEVVVSTETTRQWNERANVGQGGYVDFRTRTASSRSFSAFRILYDDRSLEVKLSATVGTETKFSHFKGMEGSRLTVIWLTTEGEQRGHFFRFLDHPDSQLCDRRVCDRRKAV